VQRSQTAPPERYDGAIDADHLVKEHGLDRAVVNRTQPAGRAQKRHLKLWLEMQHEADHVARRMSHAHD
jgi:hypothetical protein